MLDFFAVDFQFHVRWDGQYQLFDGNEQVGQFSKVQPVEEGFEWRGQCFVADRSVETDSGTDCKTARFSSLSGEGRDLWERYGNWF